MRNIPATVVLFCAALPACAQQPTLGAALQELGIPQARFTRAELSEHVIGMDAKDGSARYFVYLPGDEQSVVDVAPRLVRFDAESGAVVRNNLKSSEIERCCGTAPLEIAFTRNYLLASFHLNPSANIVLVADKHLQYKTTLYGFDFHEITPDRVVYVEDQVHFAPSHPANIAYADLRTGERRELYPPAGDPLRSRFAEFHEQHMPRQEDCASANDPCDPEIYDEDVQFLESGRDGFRVRINRSGAHSWVTKDANVDIPVAAAEYSYKLGPGGWLYCGDERQSQKLVKSDSGVAAGPDFNRKICEPNLPVVPEAPAEFSRRAQEKK